MKDNIEPFSSSNIIIGFGNKKKAFNSNPLHGEDDDNVQRLASKFNSIASIWNETSNDLQHEKNVNSSLNSSDRNNTSIWTFNYSSSNNSSITTSPNDSRWSSKFDSCEKRWEPSSDISSNGSSAFKEFEPKINRTTLTNHGSESLFVEVKKKRLISPKKENNYVPPSILSKLVAAKKELDEENLLTSPRTHFQPIQPDVFDSDSQESITSIPSDPNRLFLCSSKCPNNEKSSHSKIKMRDNRPPSVSLAELSRHLGPFESDTDDNTRLSPEVERKNYGSSSDNLNASRTTSGLDSKNKNDEFEELCTVINHVLCEESDNAVSKDDVASSLLGDFFKEKGKKSQSWPWNFDLSESSNVRPKPEESRESYHDIAYNGESIIEYNEENKMENEESEWMGNDEYYNYDYNNEEIKEETTEFNDGKNFRCNVMSDENGEVYYSWDLEQNWQNDEGLGLGQTREESGSISRRPCSFFLEGNCRRSDCKFSHDLKTITCRFWLEGGCFKGELCPFLHGFPDYLNNGDGDEEDPKYVIDSESDFPTLAPREISSEKSSYKNEMMEKLPHFDHPRESDIIIKMVKKKKKKKGKSN